MAAVKFVNIPAAPAARVIMTGEDSSTQIEESMPLWIFNSATKNIGRELLSRGLASSFEEWRFWPFPTKRFSFYGVPLVMFESPDGEEMRDLEHHIKNVGEPDIIWAEGISFPGCLGRVFELCPNSRKIIYSKYCEPWLIEKIDLYDACLVDEEWQIDEMACRFPEVPCRLWDKLVDYDQGFYPKNCQKIYDICYVARLDGRKNHRLLFEALGKLRDRHLTVALIGSNENQLQEFLEPLALQSGAQIFFTGFASQEHVNELINQSKMGVICDKYDAVPRAMLEYMAADIPVLVNEDMRVGARYIGPKAGLIRPPERFHEGIAEILEHLARFSPRVYLLENFSRDLVVQKFFGIVTELLKK
jgi:glycosyltransferase involved in cell wall biosynthesis